MIMVVPPATQGGCDIQRYTLPAFAPFRPYESLSEVLPVIQKFLLQGTTTGTLDGLISNRM